MSDDTDRIVVRFETTVPLEVAGLATSIAAIAEEFRRFSHENGTVLVVDHMTDGSVVAVFRGVVKAAIASVDPTGGVFTGIALETLAPFAGHWSGLLTALANYGTDARSDADLRRKDKATLKSAKAFVQPALKGNPIQFYGDGNKVIQNNIYIDGAKAGDIARHVDHIIAALPGEDQRFKNEPMALYQLRDARAGDLGYIDRFEKRPRRLTFATEAVKDAIIHGEARPFDVFFFVSGTVKTARGEVASYHIESIDGVTEKDAA